MKNKSITELKEEMEKLQARIEAKELAEREKIGIQIQKLTGLNTWEEIAVRYRVIPKETSTNEVSGVLD